MQSSRRRFGTSPPVQSSSSQLMRLVVGLILVVVFMFIAWKKSQEPPAPQPAAPDVNQPRESRPVKIREFKPAAPDAAQNPAQATTEITPRIRTAEESATATLIKNQKIRNQDGKVVYQGDIDLADTLDRIGRGERGSHGNDGSVFQNREKRLPQKGSGYYREWVHPTEGMRGPGPQRLVTGKNGEIYYTPDHYETFQRLDGG